MQDCFYFTNYKQSNRNKQKMSRKHTVYELYKNTVSGSKTLLSSVLLKTETCSGVLRYTIGCSAGLSSSTAAHKKHNSESNVFDRNVRKLGKSSSLLRLLPGIKEFLVTAVFVMRHGNLTHRAKDAIKRVMTSCLITRTFPRSRRRLSRFSP